MNKVSVTLPFPSRDLNPNRSKGVHWAATVGLRKKAHVSGYVLAKAAAKKARWVPTVGDVPVQITFDMPDRRRRDRDNLLAALKCSLDGVAEALGVDDSQFEPVILRRRFGDKSGAVHIEIGGLV